MALANQFKETLNKISPEEVISSFWFLLYANGHLTVMGTNTVTFGEQCSVIPKVKVTASQTLGFNTSDSSIKWKIKTF